MDRYFDAAKRIEHKLLELQELHLTGVTSMFIASKFEDVYPLLMKTVFNKIGHKKLPKESILTRELEILRLLDFRLSTPTPLEFLERYIDDVLHAHPDQEFI